jgi:hypothetical protein
MRYRDQKPFQYRLTNPPHALLNALLDLSADRQDNIAIVPASLLPLKARWQKAANTLPRRGVLLCHAPQHTRQRKLLERVEVVLKRFGYAVRHLSLEQVI